MIQKDEVPFVRKFQYNKTCLDLVKKKFHKQNNIGLQSFSRIKMNRPIPKYNFALFGIIKMKSNIRFCLRIWK